MFEKQILDALFGLVKGGGFAVTYWDGEARAYGDGSPQFDLTIRDPGLLARLQRDPAMGFGEAYMDGAIDVSGDLAAVVRLAQANAEIVRDGWLARQAGLLGGAARRSPSRQRKEVAHHYDLGNDFFRLWLDESLTYSCAYFRSPDDTLEQAQRQKIDHVLRKLRLTPDESLLDIGCGWGALVMRAARQWRVRPIGITLSTEQHTAACAAISEAGLDDRADVLLTHYQGLARKHAPFDKIASIGMIEHVGKAHLAEFCASVRMLLKPGGLALLHTITTPQEGDINSWSRKYIFPGAYIPSISEMISHLREGGFLIHDVENLRPHYQRTIDCWSDRYEQSVDQVREMFDERFVRMWRLYLRGTSASFADAVLEIHQILVSHGKTDALPMTRDDIYA